MDVYQENRSKRTLGVLALAAGAFGFAVIIGYGLAPRDEPGTVPPPTIEMENIAGIPLPIPKVTKPAPIAKTFEPDSSLPVQPITEPPKKNPNEAQGEVLGGLQIVATTDKTTCEPGESVTISWKLVNRLDEPVKYLDCRPAIMVVKDGWQGAWIAAGQNRQAQPEDLKEIGPRSELSYSRTIEWPKPPERRAEGWPDYSEPGPYQVSVSFKTDASIPMVAEQLKKEKSLDVYHQPLASGTLTITVKGEAPARPAVQKTADVINEDF